MRRSTRLAFVTTLSMLLASCAAGSASSDEQVATAPNTMATATTDTASTVPVQTVPPSTVPPPIVTIDSQPAHADEEAMRGEIRGPIDVAWIGGSEVELDGRSLPEAVARRVTSSGDRAVRFTTLRRQAPRASAIAGFVEAAVDDGADVLVVSLNIAYLSWEAPRCDLPDVPPAVRYVCVLQPADDAAAARLRTEFSELIDTIVATGLPAYLYAIPHSTTSLTDPTLTDLIATGESTLAELDPAVDHITFVPTSLTAGRDGFTEPDAFIDMVHPTELGVERLADLLAPEIVPVVGRAHAVHE